MLALTGRLFPLPQDTSWQPPQAMSGRWALREALNLGSRLSDPELVAGLRGARLR
jgi:hypothetical protein